MVSSTGTPHRDEHVLAGDRLVALRGSGLLEDRGPTGRLDRIARLARRLLGGQAALVSLVDSHHQVVRGQDGGWRGRAGDRELPVSHSFCAYVVATGEALVVGDARRSPLLRHSPAIEERDVVAYAGVPLRLAPGGDVVGTLSLREPRARTWTGDDLDVLGDLGELASAELERRARVLAAERTGRLVERPTEAVPLDLGERLRLGIDLVRAHARPGDVRARVPRHAVLVQGVRRDLDRALALTLVTAAHHAEIGSPTRVALSAERDQAVVRTSCPGTAVPVAELLRVVTAFGTGTPAGTVEIDVTPERTRVSAPLVQAAAEAHGTLVVARLPLLAEVPS